MKSKWKLAAAALIASTTMVSAQEIKYRAPAKWDPTIEYAGKFEIGQGDTVQHGKFNGIDLYWWAKFAATGEEEPGKPGKDGGTSPWVMINSISASENGGRAKRDVWKGRGDASGGDVVVATWRNGAKGAYSMTHDDYGALDWEKSIKPSYDLAKEFPDIKQSWNIIVGETEDEEWENAIAMVKDGHEIFNHSWDHTSAADQWLWFYNGQTIPAFDPSIPYELRGLKVVGAWKKVATSFDEATCKKDVPITVENELVKITGKSNWTGQTFEQGQNLTIEEKTGTKKITIKGKTLIVKYTKEHNGGNFNGLAEDGSDMTVRNEGLVAANDIGWYDLTALRKYGDAGQGWHENTKLKASTGGGTDGFWWAVNTKDVPKNCTMTDWSDGGTDDTYNCGGKNPCTTKKPCAADQGAPGLMLKLFTVDAWSTDKEITHNTKDANDEINKNVYYNIKVPGKHFAVGKVSEMFAYPFDAYSLQTHDNLKKKGIPFGRGGSKIRQVMKPDFFHPYLIDFDAFYIEKEDWDVYKGTPQGYTYGGDEMTPPGPGSAHMWFGANELVDSIIENNGYMIREFHPVVDIPDGEWHDSDPIQEWPLNSGDKDMGGSWGGITKNQLREHYEYLQEKIDDHELTVYTPSEAIKYRLTANATTGATLEEEDNNYILTAETDDMPDGYEDRTEEISFIVEIDADEMNVEYVKPYKANAATNDEVIITNPRLAPVDLGNGEWAINFNPFWGKSVRIIPGEKFKEPDWEEGTYKPVGISKTATTKINNFAFTGIRNGQINLRLTAGKYNISLYNLQGRLIGTQNLQAVNGVNATGLKTSNLAKGMLILRVKDAKGANVLMNKIMIK